jgi:hypothetical protein
LPNSGSFAQAEFFLAEGGVPRPPASAEPGDAVAHPATLEKSGEAIPEYRKAVEAGPGNPAYHLGLAKHAVGSGQLFESLESMRNAMRIAAGKPWLTAVYVSLLQNVGELKEAERLAREALERFPMDGRLLQVLLLDAELRAGGATPRRSYRSTVVRRAVLRSAAASGAHPSAAAAEREEAPGWVHLAGPATAFRDLFSRAGAGSARPRELRGLRILHRQTADATTARLKQLPITWRDLSGDDEQMAAAVAADNLDVLIELTGLTTANRLGVMARKPARVQATYIGYPNTTGVPQVDFRIVDA